MKNIASALTAAALWLAAPAGHAAPELGATFKDWAAACETVENTGQRQCYIFQNIALKDSGQRLLHFAVGYVGTTGRPAAIVTLPLGITLPPGVGLVVDEGEPVRFPLQQCTTNGCRGMLGLSDDLLAQLKAGRQARITFQDGNRREIAVPVSLIGFTAGFNSLAH